MKTQFKRTLFALATSLILSTGAHAQFVVIDPAAIIQATAQVTAWGQQLTAMKTQYDQAMTAYNSVKGITTLGDVLNSPELMSTLPKEWQDVASKVKSTATYTKELAKLGTASTPAGQKRNEAIAASNAAVTDYFTQANARVKNVQDLLALIKTTSDPKEKQDLANRLAGEQAAIQSSSQVFAILSEKNKAEMDQAESALIQARRCKVYGKC
jgi:type IV secretion system protein VirB5